MSQFHKSERRRFATFVAGLLAIALSACGGADNTVDPQTISSGAGGNPATISLTATDGVDPKTGTIGRNYIDMSRPWLDWAGQPSRVTYDESELALQIPAPTSGADMVLGVQRYETNLADRRYTLAVDSSDPNVAALIFIFDETGRMLPIAGQVGPLYVARAGEPLQFDAPAGATGFFIQVQSGWRAAEAATLRTTLIDIGAPLGDELIDPRGPWRDWSDGLVEVSFNALIGRIFLRAPESGVGHTLGVQRKASPLIAGQQYELALFNGSTPATSVLLFLIDANGALIPFRDPDTGDTQAWLQVTSDTPITPAPLGDPIASVQFVAPDGVAEMAVQIQGPWNTDESAFINPGLRALAGG